jgi:hypothetical protein
MADIYLREQWAFTVTKREMLLILKGLGGRLKSKEDIADAEALGDHLTRIKIDALKSITDRLEKAMEESE